MSVRDIIGNNNLGTTTTSAVTSYHNDDDETQARIGYTSNLRRGITFVTNLTSNFNAVAVLCGIVIVYGDGLGTGGPIVIIWGFLAAYFMTMIVSFSMAELCAAYPAAGGVYYWSAQVVPIEIAPLVAYITGWASLFGNLANCAISALVFAAVLNAAILISYNVTISTTGIVLISIVTIIIWAILNIARIDEYRLIGTSIAFLNIFTIFLLLVMVSSIPKKLNDTNTVFFEYYNNTGFESRAYVSTIGLVLPAFCFAGYDAAAQLAEETINARRNAPLGIIIANLFAGIAGFLLFLVLLYATTDINQVLHGRTNYAIINVFDSYLDTTSAQFLAWLLVIDVFLQGPGAMGVAGRVTYALARDNALPFSKYLIQVDTYFQSPVYAIIFTTGLGSLLLFFLLDPDLIIAFQSLVGLSVIGMQVSYAIPILLKILYNPTNVPKTSFSLGFWSFPFGVLSVLWLLGISAISFLPDAYPVTAYNMNWSIVATIVFCLLSTLNWIYNSSYNFKGPKRYNSGPISIDRKATGSDIASPMQTVVLYD